MLERYVIIKICLHTLQLMYYYNTPSISHVLYLFLNDQYDNQIHRYSLEIQCGYKGSAVLVYH